MSKLVTDLKDPISVQQGLVVLNLLAGNLKMVVPAAPESNGKPDLKSVPPTPPEEKPEGHPVETPTVPNAVGGPTDSPETPGSITDKTGVSYDPAIHSKPPKVNKDGTWKKSRRKDKPIEDESAPDPMKDFKETPPDEENTPPPPPTDPTHQDLLMLMGQQITAKKLTPGDIDNICAEAGIKNIPSIENDPEKIVMVHGMIVRDYT